VPLEALPEPIQRYLSATPYPASSGRLTAAHEDLLHPNRRFERPHPIPDTLSDDADAVVSVLFTADRWHYEGAAQVDARLSATRAGQPLPLEVLAAHAVREGRGGLEGTPVPFGFEARQTEQRARIPLHHDFDDHHGTILLRVQFRYAPGRVHSEDLRVFYTPAARIPGRLTGVGSDAVEDGNLVVLAGVELYEPGFYRIDANLYGPGDEPVAFATFKGELAAGEGSVPLSIYGKVLRDAGVPGPFTVRQLRGYRFQDGSFPDREQLAASDAVHVTRDWPLDAFGDEAHVSEHELRVVELMMEDLERGISLDVPGLPGAGDAPEARPPDDDLEPTAEPTDPGSAAPASP
ncbi:MAG: hypothetical protein HKP30_17680, partial [Myxococcales bacterium]|nr:hypothetical protein [Myxococcales bacterium]